MISDKPLISVIIPAYNCRNFILQSVDSILNQTYSDVEIVIADDASTDDTREIIDSINDTRIKCFHNEKNLGYLKTCNKLFAKASGRFIAFQDADDISDLRRFEMQMDVLKSGETGVVGSNMIKISANNAELIRTDWHSDIVKSLIQQTFEFIPNSFMFRREVYEQIGGYNEYFDRIGYEDFYWTVLAVEKFKAYNMPEHLYYYRVNPNSITGNQKERSMKFSYVSLLTLMAQRRETGTDWLEQKKVNKLKSFVHCKMASNEFSNGFREEALKEIKTAIKYNPFYFYNYRTWFYFFRKKVQIKAEN